MSKKERLINKPFVCLNCGLCSDTDCEICVGFHFTEIS